MSEAMNDLCEKWDRPFLPAFATVVFCPEVTGIEKFPRASFLTATIETLTSLSRSPAAAEEAQRCQQSIGSFSKVPWSHAAGAAGHREGSALQALEMCW